MSTEQSLPSRSRGLTLIELIVFIVIVSVGLAGILAVFNVTVQSSADPMIRKQMLSIAEALLEEVEAHPNCRTTDTNCAIAPRGSSCSATPGNRSQLGQVGDYSACNLSSPINDVSGSGTYLAPAGYSSTIGVTQEALNGADTVRISVTVCRSASAPCPAGADSITLEGYRARYWPDQDQSW